MKSCWVSIGFKHISPLFWMAHKKHCRLQGSMLGSRCPSHQTLCILVKPVLNPSKDTPNLGNIGYFPDSANLRLLRVLGLGSMIL